jgi:hypothetical protein
MAAETVKFVKHILETTMEQEDPQSNGTVIRRSAVIVLEGGVFKCCRFNLPSPAQYTFKDWMFLGEVVEEIKALAFPVKRIPPVKEYQAETTVHLESPRPDRERSEGERPRKVCAWS